MAKHFLMDHTGHSTIEFDKLDPAQWFMVPFMVVLIAAMYEHHALHRTSALTTNIDPATSETACRPQTPAEKAIKLLKSWLTPQQREELVRRGFFIVKGSHTGGYYRIGVGHVFNVAQLNAKDHLVCSMCFVPDNAPHVGDIMLAQKIMLETNEKLAFQIANKQSPGGGAPIPA